MNPQSGDPAEDKDIAIELKSNPYLSCILISINSRIIYWAHWDLPWNIPGFGTISV